MPDFLLPDLGEGLTEAEVIAWYVKVGDEVVVDENVVEVETAKASVEVPIPFAGVVTELHAEAGQTVQVGTPLISVESVGFDEPGIVTAALPADDSSGNVLIGYGTPSATGTRRRGRRRAVPAADDRVGPVAVISPLVRRMARESGLDLAAITGSGPSGVVVRRDVERAQSERTRSGDGQRIPLRGLRKAIADKVSRSRREIPEATVWVDVDATGLLAVRAALNQRRPQQPVSIVALLARFAVLGLRAYPELNGRVEADEIVLPSAVQLGFAVQTDRGLVVPVVHGADALTTRELSAAIISLTAAARAGSTTPVDLTGGTFTVNNYGVFGVDGSAAIINHPEVAILGIGRLIDRPWVIDGKLAVRKVGQLTLAFDHRVCDGATAGGFLRFVADCVESPVVALGEL